MGARVLRRLLSGIGQCPCRRRGPDGIARPPRRRSRTPFLTATFVLLNGSRPYDADFEDPSRREPRSFPPVFNCACSLETGLNWKRPFYAHRAHSTCMSVRELVVSEATPRAEERASAILREYHQAEAELIGKAVVLTDGKAGTVEQLYFGRRARFAALRRRPSWEVAGLNDQAGAAVARGAVQPTANRRGCPDRC